MGILLPARGGSRHWDTEVEELLADANATPMNDVVGGCWRAMVYVIRRHGFLVRHHLSFLPSVFLSGR